MFPALKCGLYNENCFRKICICIQRCNYGIHHFSLLSDFWCLENRRFVWTSVSCFCRLHSLYNSSLVYTVSRHNRYLTDCLIVMREREREFKFLAAQWKTVWLYQNIKLRTQTFQLHKYENLSGNSMDDPILSKY